MTNRRDVYPLWDWPVRILHWLIAILIPASWWTAEEGYLEVHQWLGFTILTAVLTRLLWGVVGSPQARFRDFVRGPITVWRYARGAQSGTPGHNPAGAWSVLLFWALLLMQVLTGTVNGDDVLFTGPFYYAFDSGTSDALAALHEILFKGLLALTALHVAAIVYHQWVKKKDLLRPMTVGTADPERSGTGPVEPLYKAIACLCVAALLVGALLYFAPAPPANSYYW